MLGYDLIPAATGPAKAVVILLHGLGDSRAGWLPVVPVIDLPDCAWAVVDAPDPYPPGFSWFRIPGMTDPYADRDDLLADVRRSRALIAELIVEVTSKLGLATNQVVLMGFSQGCLMVLDHAVHANSPFAGVIALSGWLAESDNPGVAAGQQQVLWLHGDQDEVVPVAGQAEGAERLRALGMQVATEVHSVGHTLDWERAPAVIRSFIQKVTGDA